MCFFKKSRAKRKAKKLAKLEAQDQAVVKEPAVKEKRVEPKVSPAQPKVEAEKTAPKAKPVAPKVPDKPESNAPVKYHVSQNKDSKSKYFKDWRVRREGSQKTIKYFPTQLEAISYAEQLAENAGSSIVIHKLDGTIRKQDYTK